MNRKELTELGYTEEQIEKLMELNGKAINSVKEELATTVSKLTEATTELEKRENDIKSLQESNVDVNEYKTKLETLSNEYTEFKEGATQREAQFKKDNAIGLFIAKSGTVDEVSLRANLDFESVTFDEEDKLVGLEEQFTTLKESKPFLFGEKKDYNGGLPFRKAVVKDTDKEKIYKSMGIKVD